jgi:uncharacterized protein YaeQ
MAGPVTLYRFRVDVSDVERGFYDVLDFRLVMHSSESSDYLLTRAIAYVLNYEEGIEITPGLASPDEPSVFVRGPQGQISLWIDIGNPSVRRLHKAAKASKRVKIYTYKDPQILIREAEGEKIHHAEEIEIFSLDGKFLHSVSSALERDNEWSLILNDGEITVSIGETSFTTALRPHRLAGNVS